MKKILFVVGVLMLSLSSFAQDLNNPSYVLNGDLIEATLYQDNGKIAQKGYYTKDNKLQGEWISYDAKGNKTAVAYYEAGKKVGTWTFYQGDVMKQVSYQESKIAEVKTWKATETRMVAN